MTGTCEMSCDSVLIEMVYRPGRMVRHGNQSPAAADIDGLAPALHVGEAVTHRQPQGIACRTSPFHVVIAHLRLVIPSESGPIPSCRADVENAYVAVDKFDFNATSRPSYWRPARTRGVTAGTGSIRNLKRTLTAVAISVLLCGSR